MLARRLSDRAGEARACASLATDFSNLGDAPKARYFHTLNYRVSYEVSHRDHLRNPARWAIDKWPTAHCTV
jgi:hypothetical protein